MAPEFEARRRPAKIATASRVTEAFGVGALLRRLPAWRGVAALVYHRVGDPEGTTWDRSVFEATVDAFDRQMRFVSRTFDVVGPQDLPDIAASRRSGRHVLISFDDGYRDTYDNAWPVLRAHGLTATWFVTTGFLDGTATAWWDEISWMVRTTTETRLEMAAPVRLALELGTPQHAVSTLTSRYKRLPDEHTEAFLDQLGERLGTGRRPPVGQGVWMTWDMVRELRRSGMAVGGHTVNHPVLSRLPEARQRDEIFGCKARLEAETGERMRWFSYPVGSADDFDGTTRALLREAGVELAFSYYGASRRPAWDPFDVRRQSVPRSATMPHFRMALTLPSLFAER